MRSGLRAAVEVGRQFGVDSDDPVIVQETNNTVVWLRPQPVIAKVGTRADSVEGLVLEHDVATALRSMGAPTVEPWTNSTPWRNPSTGFTVTLWNRLDHDPTVPVPGVMVAGSLRELHEALSLVEIELPDFRLGLRRARAALSDDDRVAALAADDVALLRNAFDALLPQLEDRTFPQCSLHGEPHDGNWLFTPSGIRWIDFESVCSGPLEWDLAFLSDSARRDFTSVDHELLALLSVLNSARVATWCWAQARFPEMRRHGEHHLNIVKSRWIEP